MSLLMKALASAEKENKDKTRQREEEAPVSAPMHLRSNADAANIPVADTLTLAATDNAAAPASVTYPPLNMSQTPIQQKKADAIRANQLAAANIFSAAQLPSSHFTSVLWGLAMIAIALCVWLGLALYPHQTETVALLLPKNTVNTDPTLLANMTSQQSPNPSIAAPIAPPSNAADSSTIDSSKVDLSAVGSNAVSTSTVLTSTNALINNPENALARKNTSPRAIFEAPNTSAATSIVNNQPAALAENKPQVSAVNVQEKRATDLPKPEPSSSLRLVSQKLSTSVDPTLLSAYQAFNQGQYPQAQQQYRQVLQKDVRNIDALLGMAAIAVKQTRDADAVGWYQKVLEIEPNNSSAIAAIMQAQPSLDSTSHISRLKSLIAQQPENAGFHAALGHAYAEQNDWLAAQAAYFEANRFAPNDADYVFNLAVSLEHLGKPALAVLQYQRALLLVAQSNATSPDQLMMQARIQALQPSQH